MPELKNKNRHLKFPSKTPINLLLHYISKTLYLQKPGQRMSPEMRVRVLGFLIQSAQVSLSPLQINQFLPYLISVSFVCNLCAFARERLRDRSNQIV